jgi:hypothetical protein
MFRPYCSAPDDGSTISPKRVVVNIEQIILRSCAVGYLEVVLLGT